MSIGFVSEFWFRWLWLVSIDGFDEICIDMWLCIDNHVISFTMFNLGLKVGADKDFLIFCENDVTFFKAAAHYEP